MTAGLNAFLLVHFAVMLASRSISSIKRAFKVVYRDSQGRLLDQALKELEASESDSAEVMQFVKCIRNSRVGIMRGPADA